MKIVQITQTDAGGAGRAAMRLHRALLAQDVESRMIVARRRSEEAGLSGPGPLGTMAGKVRSAIGRRLTGLQRSEDAGFRSTALLPSRMPKRVARERPDIVHLHWVNGEMMTPRDMTRLGRPLVWTLHDMWAFCGTEHYATTDRWRSGYTVANRPEGARGPDLDRLTWQAKRRAWTRPFRILCPSTWLADCVRASALMGGWPVSVIPNAIDTETWRPVGKAEARARLGLPADPPLVLFGAQGGLGDPRKGGDLLRAAIETLAARLPGVHLAVFGAADGPDQGVPTHYLGALDTSRALIDAYSAADVFALPSRMDNLPNTGLEALSCGTPVAAFRTGGMTDLVRHRETGYLAAPFSPGDLAEGIGWLLENPDRRAAFSDAAVRDARARFSAPVVARMHLALYDEMLDTAR